MRLKDVQNVSVPPVTRTMGSIPDWQRTNNPGNTTLSGSSRPNISQSTPVINNTSAQPTTGSHPYSSKFLNILDAVNRKEPIPGIRTDIVDKPTDPEAPITVKGTKEPPQKPYQKVEVNQSTPPHNTDPNVTDSKSDITEKSLGTTIVTEISDTPKEKNDIST